VGGCDIIREMYESGELTEMFQTHGIDARPS
jgi:monothiol glutaredoxin